MVSDDEPRWLHIGQHANCGDVCEEDTPSGGTAAIEAGSNGKEGLLSRQVSSPLPSVGNP